jgi:hypothetical protein
VRPEVGSVIEVRDRAGDFEDAIDAARREGLALVDELLELALARGGEAAACAEHRRRHLGIARELERCEPGLLALAGGGDVLADLRRWHAGLLVAQDR